MPKMICDKAGQYDVCISCGASKIHNQNEKCNDGLFKRCCSWATDELAEKGITQDVLVKCVLVPTTKYLLLSHVNETIGAAFAFEHIADDLDVGSPYDNNRQSGMDCGFAVGSNQSIIKLEDATPKMIELSEK